MESRLTLSSITKPILALAACACLIAALASPVGALQIRPAAEPDGTSVSGDGQTVHVGQEVVLRVDVVDDDGRGVAGIPVRFERDRGALETFPPVLTDSRGRAELRLPAGKTTGTQSISARIAGHDEVAPVLLEVHVRSPRWALSMILALAGGLALFLFGVDSMSASLRRAAGGRLRSILETFTHNRFVGVGAGAVVTALIQSSSATTVLLVSFVQAGILSFSRTLGVILGADIGTTFTVQLISFKLTDIALPTIALGFVLRYVSGRRRLHNAGEAILGFGLLFYGMAVMADAMEPLRDYRPFLDALHGFDQAWLGILFGTLLTALIQSSAAAIGIVIVLAQQGLIGLDQGIPLLFGANIGTCITAILASLRSSTAARRVALAHVGFKIGGVLLVVGWIPVFADWVRQISGVDPTDPANAPRLIANAHTLFNVALALVFLPFTGVVARFLERMFPDHPETSEPLVRARFLDPQVLRTPELALSLAKVEILDLGRRVQGMTQRIVKGLVDNDLDALDAIHEEEQKVDALQEQVHDYLLKIGQQHIGQQQMREVYLMLHVSVMFENMADVLDKELRRVAQKRIQNGIRFSNQGKAEIEAYHLKTVKQIARALEAFEESSLETAKRITVKQAKYDSLEVDYRRAHFERLRAAVSESVASSEIHLDIMDGLQKVSNHATSIARAMLAKEEDDTTPGTND